MSTLQNKFDEELLSIYKTTKKELNYNAVRLLQLMSTKGGLNAAKQLITKTGGTYGFEVLWENKRLDLSVEALVLKPEYHDLFSDDEREQCYERLDIN